MNELNIEKFDPTIAELNKMVAKTIKITADDLEDNTQLAIVKASRIELKNARVKIEKTGKAMREEANAFAKAVIAKEKELVAIIEPEEDRLQSIEQQAKEFAEKKERAKELPARKETLATLKDGVNLTDEEILAMDSLHFGIHVNNRKEAILENQRLEMEARENAIRDVEEKAQAEKETREREEKARIQEREEATKRLELAEKEAQMRVQREKEEADRRVKEAEEKARMDAEREKQRIAQEKYDRELAEKEAQTKLEAKKKYQAWLTKNDYNEQTHYLRNENGVITLYKIIDTYKI